MKKSVLRSAITFFVAFIALFSCKQEESERNASNALLDKKFFNDWYSDSLDYNSGATTGDLAYTIDAAEINSVEEGVYRYSEETSILLANGVYQIEGSSSKENQFFYIKEGKNTNEMMVSLTTPNSSFERYCLDSYLCMVGLPKSYVSAYWHDLNDLDVDYNINYDNDLNNLIVNLKTYRESNSVMFSENYFRLMHVKDTTRNLVELIYLKQEFGEDSIKISQYDSLNFKTYYKYSGISIGKVTQKDGVVIQNNHNTTTWIQEENGIQTASYVEKERTAWTVILVDDLDAGQIEIDVKNRVVNRINNDDSRSKISDIQDLENRRVINGEFI